MSETTERTDVVDELHDAERPGSAVVEYNATAAGLAELRARLKDAKYDLTTVKGNALARADRKELVSLRTSLEAKRRELKAPALERARLIDAEAKRIEGEILALERPLDEVIKADEARREAERKAKAEAEARAAARVAETLDGIRAFLVKASHKGSIVIETLIEDLVALPIPDEVGDAGEQLRTRVLEQLRGMLTEAQTAEAEARKLRVEREAFEREQREAAAAAAEREAELAAAEVKRIAVLAEAEAAAERRRAEEQAELDRQRAELEADRKRVAEEQAERERRAYADAKAAADKRIAEAKAAEGFERDWLDAIAEDQRRTADLEQRRRLAEEEAARQVEIEQARARDRARHEARADALELVSDLAGMPTKPPIKSIWIEIVHRATGITAALHGEAGTE
jgi:hypothetical protein